MLLNFSIIKETGLLGLTVFVVSRDDNAFFKPAGFDYSVKSVSFETEEAAYKAALVWDSLNLKSE